MIRYSVRQESLREIRIWIAQLSKQEGLAEMAKFYVQSGNFRTTISADDAEKAALWVVHKAMGQVMPVYDDHEMLPEQKGHVAVANGLMVLGNTVRLSELGFESEAGVEWDTFELLVQWHQLMIAVSRLEELICGGSQYNPAYGVSSDKLTTV